MALYVDPTGKEFDVPDDPTPQELAEIRQMKLRPKGDNWHGTKDLIKSIISGGVEGVARTPLIMGDIGKLASIGINKIMPDAISSETISRMGSQPWVDAFKDSPQDRWLKDNLGLDATHEPQTTAGRYGKAGASAVTGAATMGGLGAIGGPLKTAGVALTPPMLAINAASGVGGELGYDLSRNFDETKLGNPVMALAGGVGTGTTLGALRAWHAPNIRQEMYNALQGMEKKDWQATRKDLRNFERSGSKSFTLADLPHLQGRIGGTAQDLTNTTGGNALQQKLSLGSRMNEDIPNIHTSMLDDVLPGGVDHREIAKALSDKGTARIEGMERQRGLAMGGALDNAPPVDPNVLIPEVVRNIRMPMLQGGNSARGTQQAFAAAEEAFLGRPSRTNPVAPFLLNGQGGVAGHINLPTTNVRALSKEVKGLQKIPTADAKNPSVAISNHDKMLANEAAKTTLETASPDFRRAMAQYGFTTENLIKPAENALTGKLRGLTDGKAVLRELRNVPIVKLQQELNGLGLSDVEVRQLARMVGESLDPVPNLTKGSDTMKQDRQIFETLLDYVNPDLAKQAGNKLDVKDSLSRLSSEHAADRTANMQRSKNPLDLLFRPASRVGLRVGEKEAQKLSDLLANPTPENLDKLREMAKIDPRAKRALEWIGTLSGAAQSSAVHRSGQ